MPPTAEEYFKKEVIKSVSAAAKLFKEFGDLGKSEIKEMIHALNDQEHKSGYPITHMHLKKCINGGGAIKHAETSKAAAAILASPELKKLAQKYANSSFKDRLLFKTNRDLARAFYEATVMLEVEDTGKSLTVKGKLIDTFDFRWGWFPKDKTVRGAKLRAAGNIAYMAQALGLLKPVKLEVALAGVVK